MGAGGHLFMESDRGPGQTQLTDRRFVVMNAKVGVVHRGCPERRVPDEPRGDLLLDLPPPISIRTSVDISN